MREFKLNGGSAPRTLGLKYWWAGKGQVETQAARRDSGGGGEGGREAGRFSPTVSFTTNRQQGVKA